MKSQKYMFQHKEVVWDWKSSQHRHMEPLPKTDTLWKLYLFSKLHLYLFALFLDCYSIGSWEAELLFKQQKDRNLFLGQISMQAFSQWLKRILPHWISKCSNQKPNITERKFCHSPLHYNLVTWLEAGYVKRKLQPL